MSSKDWLEKDYYKVLGLKKDASEADIKKAFHKLARENHPDQHPGDKTAEKKFKEVSEAYAVLSDPKQRKEYDEARSLFGGGGFRFPRGGGAPGGGAAAGNFEDLFARARAGQGADDGFADLLGGLFGQGAGTRTTRRSSSRRGADVEGEVTITFLQAVEGTTVSLQLVSDQACPACRGTGARAGSAPHVCPRCEGSGMQTASSGGVFATSEPCPECHGRGLVVDDPCPECNGTGHAHSAKTMQVRVPAGVTDGQRIRIKGKGSPGENGGAPGDLFVVVHVEQHRLFGRQGNNLTLTVPITFAEASLGAEIDVPTLEGGTVRMRIPAGTPNGRTLRVRGRGVEKGGSCGDLLVTVEIAVPPSINDDAKHALEEYARATSGFAPRQALFG